MSGLLLNLITFDVSFHPHYTLLHGHICDTLDMFSAMLGAKCNTNSQCKVANAECFKTCICKTGYYEDNNSNCVTRMCLI